VDKGTWIWVPLLLKGEKDEASEVLRKYIDTLLPANGGPGVLFYTYSDHLVFFTHYCVMARKHRIRVLSLCEMPDHIHDSVFAERKEDLEQFKREMATTFSKCHNDWFHKRGPVLEGPFGRAPKREDKKARSNLVYVGNNPVERKLAVKAEDYRWNYLAYADSDHPFSEKLVIRNARWPLQKAVREVKIQFRAGRPMNYPMVTRLFAALTPKECLQLADMIISTYNVIDYQAAIAYFGSLENMLLAMHATTGSEYDLQEEFVGKSDACYNRMTGILLRTGKVKNIHELQRMPVEEREKLVVFLKGKTDGLPDQVAKFLHLPVEYK
jgi:hypothetical protein